MHEESFSNRIKMDQNDRDILIFSECWKKVVRRKNNNFANVLGKKDIVVVTIKMTNISFMCRINV